jgi:hypothetical protein
LSDPLSLLFLVALVLGVVAIAFLAGFALLLSRVNAVLAATEEGLPGALGPRRRLALVAAGAGDGEGDDDGRSSRDGRSPRRHPGSCEAA